LGNHVGQIRVGPPIRGAASEIVLTALIFIGASAASMLAGLALSAIPLALFRSTDEGVLFLQLFIFNCITLLINPVLFATIAANHCRRVPVYFVPLTFIPWLRQISAVRPERNDCNRNFGRRRNRLGLLGSQTKSA